MSWLQFNVSAASDSTTVNGGSAQSSASDNEIFTQMSWRGIQHSIFDGYERITAGTQNDEWVTFTADSSNWPNRIRWFNPSRNAITVQQPTGKLYHFEFFWMETYPEKWPHYDHIDQFTVNFGPIPEIQEVMPETFLKFLERLGHDDGFLRIQHRMQKKLTKARLRRLKKKGKHPHDALPPWDPRGIARLEESRIKLRAWLDKHIEEQQPFEEILMERWGIREIPPITPELLDQIEASSRKFLEECLSPAELEWFDEHGHCKIKSDRNSNIYYIVKVDDDKRVQRFINDKHEANICIHSKWRGLPAFDTLAMKILYIKNAEEEFLKVGNITKMRH